MVENKNLNLSDEELAAVFSAISCYLAIEKANKKKKQNTWCLLGRIEQAGLLRDNRWSRVFLKTDDEQSVWSYSGRLAMV